MGRTTGSPLYVLLGDPVAHSLSPLLYQTAFEAARLRIAYVALRVPPRRFRAVFQGLAAVGVGGNLTIPFKERVLSLLDRKTLAVRAIGACNTFWVDAGGRIWGDNTDKEGFLRALRSIYPMRLGGKRALLVGAGGGARAVAVGLLEAGLDQLLILNRSRARLTRLVRFLRQQFPGRTILGRPLKGAQGLAGSYELVVQATPVGLRPQDRPLIDPRAVPGLEVCVDLVYGHPTELLLRAAKAGLLVLDGTTMLLEQAALSFERWTGLEAPRQAMRVALDRAVKVGAP